MAAKKTTSKSASPPQGKTKPAIPAKAAKAVKPVKPAKPVPAKPVTLAQPSPSVKKASATAVTKKSVLPVKPAPAVKASPVAAKVAVVESKSHKPVKAAAPVRKGSTSHPRSSLVDFPVPPAPVKPPFVPPKPAHSPSFERVASAENGSHSPAFIQKQRQRLLDLRDELVDTMSGMTRDTIRKAPEGSEASGSGQHQGDAGSDAYDRDFALSVLAKEQDALYEIEQALRRIETNTYGICEISSRKIPQARLEVIPFARLTVECQALWEKEYGKRRFRPSNEVGFSGGKFVEEEDSETVLLDEEEE
jgi:RNA polymerase-binding transcription factor DksA